MAKLSIEDSNATRFSAFALTLAAADRRNKRPNHSKVDLRCSCILSRRGAGNGRSSRKVLTFTATLHYKRSVYKRLDFKGVRSFRGEAGKGARGRAPVIRRVYMQLASFIPNGVNNRSSFSGS